MRFGIPQALAPLATASPGTLSGSSALAASGLSGISEQLRPALIAAWPRPNKRHRNHFGSSSSQLVKFLLSSTLDHAPFPCSKQFIDRGPRNSRRKHKTFKHTCKSSQLSKQEQRSNPQITRRAWWLTLQQQRLLLKPQLTAQAYCESLFTPFRTVIGGHCLGIESKVRRQFPFAQDEQSIKELVRARSSRSSFSS